MIDEEVQISVVASAARPEYWIEFYNNLYNNCNISFEIVFVGPCEPNFNLPNNFRYYKSDVKVTQCVEAAIRFSIGKITKLIKTINIAADIANSYNPNPTAAPTAAVAHIIAAVVKPSTLPSFSRKIIIPAPKNPMPTMICPKVREGSKLDTPKY